MADSEIICDHCGEKTIKPNGQVNRAVRDEKPLYCNRKCSGLAQRCNKTSGELKEEKRLYDIGYRNKNSESMKIKKAEYFQRTYDPAEAAIERKKNMHRHVEYCRKPEYRAKKKIFDRKYVAKKCYGDLWEVQVLTLDIQDEVKSRMTKQQIRVEAGIYNKSQRRHRHEQRTNSEKFESRTLGDTH